MRGTFSKFTVMAALVIGTVACSSSDDDAGSADTTEAPAAEATDAPTEATEASDAPATTEAATTTAAATTTTEAATTTTEEPEILRIMVTNDDGVGAEGIDVLVNALTALDDVEVTVIAPAENQSGTSDSMTDGPLTVNDAATISGYPAKAVVGFPADTVIHGFDQGGLVELPHLLVAGINEGHNTGPVIPISGTVGAARTAAKRGIPAIASSQQNLAVVEGQPEIPLAYEATAEVVVAWIEQNRENLLAGSMPPFVYNINGPTCQGGEPREVASVPAATDFDGRDYYAPADCVLEPAGPPTDDMDALVKGFVSYTELDPNTLLPAA